MTYGRGRLAMLAAGVVLGMGTLAASASADGGVAVPGLSEQQMRKVETELLGSRHAAEHARQRAAKRKDARRWRALTASAAPRRPREGRERRAPLEDPRPRGRRLDGRPLVGRLRRPAHRRHPRGAAADEQDPLLRLSRRREPQHRPRLAVGHRHGPVEERRPAAAARHDQHLEHLVRRAVADGRRARARHRRQPRVLLHGLRLPGAQQGLHVQPVDGDLAAGARHGPRALVPDPDAAARRLDAHRRRLGRERLGRDEPRRRAVHAARDGTGRGTVRRIGGFGAENGGPNRPGLYPHMFVLNTGNVLAAGPWKWDAWLFSRTAGGTASWTDRPDWDRDRNYGAALLLPGGPEGSSRVMQIGGYQGEESVATSLIADGARAGQPQAGPTLNVARSHTNVIAGPDGSCSRSAGATATATATSGGRRRATRQVEILDPGSSTWRLGPSQFFKRAYHSTALLLPDGRIMSAGDDNDPAKAHRPDARDRRGRVLRAAVPVRPRQPAGARVRRRARSATARPSRSGRARPSTARC